MGKTKRYIRTDNNEEYSMGDLAHHVSKKLTQKTHKSQKEYKRKDKHKKKYY